MTLRHGLAVVRDVLLWGVRSGRLWLPLLLPLLLLLGLLVASTKAAVTTVVYTLF